MFALDREKMARDHNREMKFVKGQIARKNYEGALRLIEAQAKHAYRLHYLDRFSDDKMEDMILEIAPLLCAPLQETPSVNKKRIVFVDSFAFDYRGYTQQYLYALWDLGYEILFIRTHNSSMPLSEQILKDIEAHSGQTKLLVLESHFSYSEKIRTMVQTIKEFAPSKAFMHLSPWDVAAVATMSFFPQIEKYQIDFTDHAFWLGKAVTDKLLVFRDWGAYISAQYRGIDKSRIYKHRTYPIINQSVAFEGFPLDLTGYVVGFSGGSVYKIKDADNTFLNMIASLLKQYENFIFLFAQIGDDSFIRDFIKANGLEKRFLLIGNRKDIYQVYQHIDIYFSTYPYGGGNMILYAAATQKPMVTLTQEKLVHTHTHNVLDSGEKLPYESWNVPGFLEAASKLITNKELRASYGQFIFSLITTRQSFTEELKDILEGNARPAADDLTFDIDLQYLHDTHVVFEDFDKKAYYKHLRSMYGLKGLIRHNPTKLLMAFYYSFA